MEVPLPRLDSVSSIVMGTLAAGKGMGCVVVGVVSEVPSLPKGPCLINTVALFRIRLAY